MPAVTDEEIVYVTDPQSGIKIPEKLAAMSAPVESFQANPWNPNKMDAFMREKLISSIQRDGFFQPLLVRPLVVDHIPVPGKWEIIDGEHRWKVGKDDLGMGALPYINLGQIGDAAAARPVHADRMYLIDIGHGAVALGEIADLGERRHVAVIELERLSALRAGDDHRRRVDRWVRSRGRASARRRGRGRSGRRCRSVATATIVRRCDPRTG